MKENGVLRILDANLNRFREALRVCEDIARFTLEDRSATTSLKKLRHRISNSLARSKKIRYASLILSRDSKGDIGKGTLPQELKRENAIDALRANMQRAKESARVLEEISKIIDHTLSFEFKKTRFDIYDIEKRLAKNILSKT